MLSSETEHDDTQLIGQILQEGIGLSCVAGNKIQGSRIGKLFG